MSIRTNWLCAVTICMVLRSVCWAEDAAFESRWSAAPQASETRALTFRLTDATPAIRLAQATQPPTEATENPQPTTNQPPTVDNTAQPPTTPRDPIIDLAPPEIPDEPPEDDQLAQVPDLVQPPPFSALLLASVPNMIGDFFGISGAQVAITGPLNLSVRRSNNLFVENANGGIGADPNPAVPVRVLDGAQNTQITMSTGPGTNVGGRFTYPVAEPTTGAPPPPASGTVTFTDGNLAFTGDGSPVGNATDWTLTANYLYTPDPNGGAIFTVPPVGGAVTRRVKLAENNSPRPQDRILFNYNFFDNVIAGIGDVSRYTLGFEKTYWDGQGSIEFRAPLAGTLSSRQRIGVPRDRDTELGNLSVIWKHVLLETDRCLVSAGTGCNLPTADDSRVLINNTVEVLRVRNEAVHILPFVAALGRPTDRCFWQAFLQFDIDANGNTVLADLSGGALPKIGVFNDATLMFIDLGTGYELYRDDYASLLRRVTALAEVHYSSTLQDEDVVAGNGLTVGGFFRRFDVVDLTLGASALLGQHTSVRPGIVMPLLTGKNRHFDYEATIQVNVFF